MEMNFWKAKEMNSYFRIKALGNTIPIRTLTSSPGVLRVEDSFQRTGSSALGGAIMSVSGVEP